MEFLNHLRKHLSISKKSKRFKESYPEEFIILLVLRLIVASALAT